MSKQNLTLPIYDITKYTMLDYPGKLACILWFAGCNMRCSFCYNPHIVFGKGSMGEEKVLEFLVVRKGFLDGVVLSGGECTIYSGIGELCRKIKKLGYAIKLDTNGLEFETIKQLVDENLVDFIALDYKAPEAKFYQITASNKFSSFSKTLDFLISSKVDFEVRTTVHPDLLDATDLNMIIDDLHERGYSKTYCLQNFMTGTKTIGNLANPTKRIELDKLNMPFGIELRNFDQDQRLKRAI